jgi:hypothetical protein
MITLFWCSYLLMCLFWCFYSCVCNNRSASMASTCHSMPRLVNKRVSNLCGKTPPGAAWNVPRVRHYQHNYLLLSHPYLKNSLSLPLSLLLWVRENTWTLSELHWQGAWTHGSQRTRRSHSRPLFHWCTLGETMLRSWLQSKQTP